MGHSPRFALRSYAYLASHALVAAPASWLFAPDASGADASWRSTRSASPSASARAGPARLGASHLRWRAARRSSSCGRGLFVVDELPRANSRWSASPTPPLTSWPASTAPRAPRASRGRPRLALRGVAHSPTDWRASAPSDRANALRRLDQPPPLVIASFAIDRHFYGRDTWSVANIVRTTSSRTPAGIHSCTASSRRRFPATWPTPSTSRSSRSRRPFAATSASAFRETPRRVAPRTKLLVAYSPFPRARSSPRSRTRSGSCTSRTLTWGSARPSRAPRSWTSPAPRRGRSRPAAPRSSPPRSRFCSSSRTRSSPRRGSRRSWTGTARDPRLRGLPESSESESSFRGQSSSAGNRPGSRLVCVASGGTGSELVPPPRVGLSDRVSEAAGALGIRRRVAVPFDPASGGARRPTGIERQKRRGDEQWTELDRCAFVVDAKGLGGGANRPATSDGRSIGRKVIRSRGGSASRWNPERGKPNRERARAESVRVVGRRRRRRRRRRGRVARRGRVRIRRGGRVRRRASRRRPRDGSRRRTRSSRRALARALARLRPGWSLERNTYGAVVV